MLGYSLFYINSMNNLASISVQTRDGQLVNLQTKDCNKGPNNVISISHTKTRVYCLTEEGLVSKFVQETQKFSVTADVSGQKGPKKKYFTCLGCVDSRLVAASIEEGWNHMSICELVLLKRNLKVAQTFQLQVRSPKLCTKILDPQFDPNPIHKLAVVKAKSLSLLLASNWSFNLHVFAVRKLRLHFLSSHEISKRDNHICGILVVKNTAFLHGWKKYLREFKF